MLFRSDPNGDVRWSQLVEARRFMEGLAGDSPALFGGDFNLTRSSRYYPGMTSRLAPLDRPGGPRSGLSTHASRGWTEIREEEIMTGRIDYIWTRPGSRVRWQARAPARLIFTEPVKLTSGESVPISDHPIVAVPFCLAPVTREAARSECP